MTKAHYDVKIKFNIFVLLNVIYLSKMNKKIHWKKMQIISIIIYSQIIQKIVLKALQTKKFNVQYKQIERNSSFINKRKGHLLFHLYKCIYNLL